MSAGGLFGLVFNFFAFAAFWTIIGVVFDKVGAIFNTTIRLMPTFQDAINGFSITQTIYGVLPLIVFIALLVNYLMNENAMATGEV
jgi:hypothetical protein